MRFADVVGQEAVKALLQRQAAQHRVPHALLFAGPEGLGKMGMALAFANLLLCQHPEDGEPCGECPACKQVARLGHPDLHFSFPIVKGKSGREETSADHITTWQNFLQGGCYFGNDDWLATLGEEKKRDIIPEAESDLITDRVAISSFEGGYKVIIVWQVERMNITAQNKLLKTLEEPSPNTVFLLLANSTQDLLSTIMSRVQQVPFRPISQDELAEALQTRNGLDRQMAVEVARMAGGSYLNALRHITSNTDRADNFKRFTSLMRMAYSADVAGLQKWATAIAAWGRDRQLGLLAYFQFMLRESFMYNFHLPELNFMSDDETAFASRFARFINERNVRQMVEQTALLQRQIGQNINARVALFDYALQVIILLKK